MSKVCWLIILPRRVGWDIMGYTSDPIPSYHELRNWIYSNKLSYTTSSYTPQVHFPHPGPTIAPTVSSLASAPHPCTAHRWGGTPPFPIWLPTASWCTPQWGGDPRIPLPPLLRGNTALRLPLVLLSPLWSVPLPCGRTPPGPWSSPSSPPRSFCCTRAPTMPSPNTSFYPVHSITLATIPHRLQAFRRF